MKVLINPTDGKGVFYRRVDASDEKLNPDEITKIRLESHQQSFDAPTGRVYGRPANPGDINEAEVKRYIQEIGEGKRSRVMTYSDVVSALKNFDLVSGDRSVKNAALLLFGNKPQDAFPQSRINFLIYEGDVIADNALKLKRVIEGSIIKQIKEAFQLIRANTENRIAMDGLRRIEIDQYPSNAIREAIINAAAHRDYLISGADITIKLFGNRLEITNPWTTNERSNDGPTEEGGHPSSRRNPLICRMLDNLGYMEQSGQGIKSMIEAMRKYGLEEPKISLVDDFFK